MDGLPRLIFKKNTSLRNSNSQLDPSVFNRTNFLLWALLISKGPNAKSIDRDKQRRSFSVIISDMIEENIHLITLV